MRRKGTRIGTTGKDDYKNVELPVKHRRDRAHQFLPLFPKGHIANRPGNFIPTVDPLFQASLEHIPVSRTSVHSRPKAHQFRHNRIPEHPNPVRISNQKTRRNVSKCIAIQKQKLTQYRESRRSRGRSFLEETICRRVPGQRWYRRRGASYLWSETSGLYGNDPASLCGGWFEGETEWA